MTLAMCHAGSNTPTLRQVEEVELPSVTGPLRIYSKLQLTPHEQAETSSFPNPNPKCSCRPQGAQAVPGSDAALPIWCGE